MLLNWLFGGGAPKSLNLPPVSSISTGGNTYTGSGVPLSQGGSGGGFSGRMPGGGGGGGVVVPPGGGGGGVTPQPGPTDWQYPGLLNAPYMMTNWYGK
jgi:hypothetical protein